MPELNDRELLEWAAKAAGFDLSRADYRDKWGFEGVRKNDVEYIGRWNPLNDDGDALRLAIKLGISIYADDESYVFGVTTQQRQAETSDQESGLGWCECWNNDRYAATRRAIVRAAAAIGQAMHNG